MPTYDYTCHACRWEGEGVTTIDGRHGYTCPRCGSVAHLMAPRRAPAGRIDLLSRARSNREKGLIELGNEHPVDVERFYREQREDNERRESQELRKELETHIEREGGWDSFVTRDPTVIRQQHEAMQAQKAKDPTSQAREITSTAIAEISAEPVEPLARPKRRKVPRGGD